MPRPKGLLNPLKGENARKAGAEQMAPDDLSAAKSWLNQAEKAYGAATSLLSSSPQRSYRQGGTGHAAGTESWSPLLSTLLAG